MAVIGTLAGSLSVIPSAGAAPGGDAGQAGRAQGRQVFLLVNTDPNEDGGLVAASGPIHAVGEDMVLGPRKDRFVFPDGSVVIRHRPVRTPKDSFDDVTCAFSYAEVGRWRVIRGSGDYVDAAGRGRYRVMADGIGRKDAQGQCSQDRPPREFYVRIRAVGHLRY